MFPDILNSMVRFSSQNAILFKRVLLLLCLSMISQTYGAGIELQVKNISDKNTSINTWTIQYHTDFITIYGKTDLEEVRVTTDLSFNTTHFQLINPQHQNNIVAQRHNQTITVKGIHHGKPINTAYTINALGWVIAPGLQLQPFIRSVDQQTSKWIMSWDSFNLHQLQFKKESTTTQLRIGEHLHKAIRVRMAPPGLGQFFWSADLWVDPDSGYFLKYKGPSGGLNSPQKVSEVISVTPSKDS